MERWSDGLTDLGASRQRSSDPAQKERWDEKLDSPSSTLCPSPMSAKTSSKKSNR